MELLWKRVPGREPMEEKRAGDLVYLSFPALEQTGFVRHGFSTRLGGVSEGKFASMNLTFTRGDCPEHVMENYRRMAAALGADLEKFVLSWQTHTTNIRVVTEKDAGKGIFRERDYQDVDGLVTNVPGMTLVTFYADCVPLYFVDPVHKAIGLSHSGWRGTVNRMGQKTVEMMRRQYGTDPADLTAAIGPSICQHCFEVGKEVADAFSEAFASHDHASLFYKKANGRYQLDLWQANRLILQEAGIPAGQIHTTDICTHCNPQYLFSHRTQGTERGNLAAFLGIR